MCFVESTRALRLSRHFNASSALWRHATPSFVLSKVFGRAPQMYTVVSIYIQFTTFVEVILQLIQHYCLHACLCRSFKVETVAIVGVTHLIYSYPPIMWLVRIIRMKATFISTWTLTKLYRWKVSVSEGNLKSCPECFEFCCQRHAETSKCS